MFGETEVSVCDKCLTLYPIKSDPATVLFCDPCLVKWYQFKLYKGYHKYPTDKERICVFINNNL